MAHMSFFFFPAGSIRYSSIVPICSRNVSRFNQGTSQSRDSNDMNFQKMAACRSFRSCLISFAKEQLSPCTHQPQPNMLNSMFARSGSCRFLQIS
jgi:hypothetical protein